jgi:signal transduction histidine kinase
MRDQQAYNSIQRPLLIFYILVIYVFLQFCWWSYLLFDLNHEIIGLKIELSHLNASNEAEILQLKEKLSQKRLMIFGEGIVFMFLLTLGIIQTRKSFKRETLVARQQKNFMLSVTHELKSPVASVKLFLQTLGKRELERTRQQELIHTALEETNRLDHLIENILLLNRIDNQAFSINIEHLNLTEILHDFGRHLQLKGQKPLVTLDIESNLFVKGDRFALQSILQNLIENANKYAGNSPEICIRASRIGKETVYMRIEDTGMGVGLEDQKRIFNRFFRAGNEETRRTKGTGLGLYIVNYLMRMQHGSIHYLPNEPQGSIFECRFKTSSI